MNRVARILFTWELGGGMGHIAPYLTLARGLRQKGHEVAFTLRDLRLAEISLGAENFPYFQAPVMLGTAENEVTPPYTFAQILHNVGYGNPGLLTGLAKAWRQLFDTYRPDLIIYDHSPTALLASCDMKCKKVIIGSGFFIPPDVTPPPLLRNNPVPDMAVLASFERQILANINQLLTRFGGKPLDRIAQLYQADDKILMTFKEIDHYQMRPQQGVTYWGVNRSGLGSGPEWPKSKGKRIYAYLKRFNALEHLLHYLRSLDASVIIYAPDLNETVMRKYSSPTLQFSRSPLDMEETASSCDFAITNSTHATVVAFLLAGKPVLLLPKFLEQALLAIMVERLGAGLIGALNHPQHIISKLDQLMTDPQYTRSAEKFAEKHADFDADDMEKRLINHIDSLLTSR
jgi:UDP:flavonoid glycosyltransferase YjiC (YdhE family)